MKLNYLCSLLLAISLTACTFTESKKDNQIDPQIKDQIHVLSDRIFNGFVQNKPENVLTTCSDRLLNNREEIKKLMQLLQGNLQMRNLRILNEYYQKNASKKNVGIVSSGQNNNHDYVIRYEALDKEMYVLVGSFITKTDQKCITLIFGKHDNHWKLSGLQAGLLKIMNKDAYDWYRLAKSDYERGYYIDALCNINLSTQLLKPANHFWQYQKEREIETFEQKITKQIYSKYSFPLTVNEVETKPVIFRVYPQVMPDGCYPLIMYTTSVDFDDVQKLAKECNAIHDQIGKLFKGIENNNKKILYRPFKTIPTGTETGKQYGFMKETN